MIRLSIIIPVFNVERYLSKCLDSVVDQDIPSNNYEIIIVIDGSPDNSILIANDYAERYSNIKIICQSNQGLSVARNNGLSIANGEYIWFIDSDDWIEKNCLCDLLDLCEKNQVDILSVDRMKVFDNKSTTLLKTKSKNINNIISGKECFIENKFQIPAQLYIYRKFFLLSFDLQFTPKLYHEDQEFLPRAIYFANKFLYSGKVVYYHMQRVGSITQTVNPKRCYDLLKICELLSEFSVKNINEKAGLKSMNLLIFFTLTSCAILAYKINDTAHSKIIYYQLRNKKEVAFKVLFSRFSIVSKIEAFVFLVSPSYFAKLYTLLKRVN